MRLYQIDKMPLKVWHNVFMGQAAQVVLSPPPFSFDWREIERGLPLSVLDEFSAYSGIPVKALLDVVVNARTLKHRRHRNEPLNIDESDRLARVAKMYELAMKVYSDRDDGREWLCGKKRRFDGKTALEMLRTEAGEHAVQEFLIQIDEGMFV
jgi:putative toxin-antitoxin system antitoxin component (TIGR02293 family)